MAMQVGVGYSRSRNTVEAGREAAAKALAQGGFSRPDFVLVFATVGYDQPALIRSVREATATPHLCGCSGEGVITRGMAEEGNFCVAVMAVRSGELRFANLLLAADGASEVALGERLAREAQKLVQEDTVAYFLFADGLGFDFEPLLFAFEGALPPKDRHPILGGLASDNWALHRTFQYHEDRVISGGVALAVLSGSGRIAWAVNHGCVPIGIKRIITKSSRNVIHELDGVPALEALKDYFEEDLQSQWNKMSLNLCLGFKTPEQLVKDYDEFVIRYMMAKDDRTGSVIIQSDVAEGTELWIVRRDKELIRDGLMTVSRQIAERTEGATPALVLHFECVGRGKAVFREQEKLELIQTLQTRIGGEVPWIGFYTYGEIAPIASRNFFHNFSAVVAALY